MTRKRFMKLDPNKYTLVQLAAKMKTIKDDDELSQMAENFLNEYYLFEALREECFK